MIHGGADSETVTASNVQKEMLDLYMSEALETNKKHKKRDRKLLAVLFLLFCFDVIWGKCLSKVRVVFVNIWYKYTKKIWNGCEKLYFTELLCERKRKARYRKENFNIAPLLSCFVTVSVFVGISVDVPYIKGCRTGWECLHPAPPPPPVWMILHPTLLFLHSNTTSNAGAEENSEGLWGTRAQSWSFTATFLSCLLLWWWREKNGHGADYIKDMTVFLSPRRPFFPFNIQTSQASITGFTELLGQGMHYWLVNGSYE